MQLKDQELVSIIDPGLTFVMHYGDSAYKVERDGSPYVLKFFYYSNEWGRKRIETERRALELAHSIPGITHLVEYYGYKGPYIALLKEHFDGDIVYWIEIECLEKLDYQALKPQMNETMEQLHDLGLSNLEIRSRNTIVSPDRLHVRHVDLGSCVFRDDDLGLFMDEKNQDKHDLDELFPIF